MSGAVQGMADLERRFDALPEAVREAVRVEVGRLADEMVARMRSLAPRRYGVLAESIDWTWGIKAPVKATSVGHVTVGPVAATIYVAKAAFYARFVEFGTRPHAIGRNASVARGLRQTGKLHPGAQAEPFFFPVVRLVASGGKAQRRVNAAARKAAAKTWGT